MLKTLKYLLKHKWFVMLECFKVGLYWRGIIHDWDKFLIPSIAIPILKYRDKIPKDNGYYNATETIHKSFNIAMEKHLKRSKHHWQHYITFFLEGNKLRKGPLIMSNENVLEMICDWKGAKRASKSELSAYNWYQKNKCHMILHEKTQEKVERFLKGL